MKIVFMVSSMNAGGAERVAATLSNAWVEQGHQVTLVSTFPVRGKSFYTLDPAVRLVWMADLLGKRARSQLGPVWKLLEMRRFLRQEQPDVVVSFLTNVNVMTLLATHGLDLPVVVCERTNPVYSQSAGRVLPVMRRWLYPRASAVSVQTRATAADFGPILKNVHTLDVLPNPLPPDLAAMPTATLQPDDHGRFRLVAMGRLQASKQFDRLIAMFARVHADFPDWDLFIYGEGPLRADLEAQVRDQGLAGRVQLPGRTPLAWNALQKGALFAMTSSVEGFPNALLESMALGLPAVVYDCPSGPNEMTEGGRHAMLVPLDDEDAFVAALRVLMSDPGQRMELGQKAAHAMRASYGLPVVLAHWQAVFSRITKHHG
ncbi:MAG: glycosyltransferase family 4 protein [Pusillimonas sp.]